MLPLWLCPSSPTTSGTQAGSDLSRSPTASPARAAVGAPHLNLVRTRSTSQLQHNKVIALINFPRLATRPFTLHHAYHGEPCRCADHCQWQGDDHAYDRPLILIFDFSLLEAHTRCPGIFSFHPTIPGYPNAFVSYLSSWVSLVANPM